MFRTKVYVGEFDYRKRVVVKCVEIETKEKMQEMIERGIGILCELDSHLHIVNFSRCWQQNESLCIILERCDFSLQEFIMRQKECLTKDSISNSVVDLCHPRAIRMWDTNIDLEIIPTNKHPKLLR